MSIYISFFAFIIIVAIILKKEYNLSLFLSLIALWLLIGLRDITVGPDTESYVMDFKEFSYFNFTEMLSFAGREQEPLYVVFSWLPSCLSSDYSLFLLAWAIFPLVAFYITFKENFKTTMESLVSIMVFFLLGLFAFYVAGIRQTAALSIILLSFRYLKNPNLWKFLLCIFFAYMVHNSAAVFVIAYPLKQIRIRWWYIFIAIALFVASSYLQIDQLTLATQYLFKDRFSSYGTIIESSQNSSAFIMQFFLFLICLLKYKQLTKKDSSNNLLFLLLLIGLLCQSMSGLLAEMARVSFYFCIFDLILVPRAINEFRSNKNTVFVTFVIVSLFYLLFLSSSNLPEYHFA